MAVQQTVIRVDQELESVRECSHVEEAEEIADLLKATVESKGSTAARVYPRFRRIVSCCGNLSAGFLQLLSSYIACS